MAGRTNDTKERILKLSIQKVEEDKISELSLRQLASELGLTTGSFYKHYKNKHELMLATLMKLSTDFMESVKNTFNKNDSSEANIKSIALKILNEFQQKPEIMNFIFFSEESQSSINQDNPSFPFLQLMDKLVSEVIKENKLHKDKQLLFIQLWSFVQGYGMLLINGSTTLDDNLIDITLKDFLEE